MLTIVLPAYDQFGAVEIQMEHSLVSLSKWESIHEKAFFGHEEKTREETVSYFRQMLLSYPEPPMFDERITTEVVMDVQLYINSKQTATTLPKDNKPPSREIVTSELIYYWMIAFQVPFECEHWHLNRLMTLIQVCGVKQTKPKRMSKQALSEQYRQLNAERRAQLGTNG